MHKKNSGINANQQRCPTKIGLVTAWSSPSAARISTTTPMRFTCNQRPAVIALPFRFKLLDALAIDNQAQVISPAVTSLQLRGFRRIAPGTRSPIMPDTPSLPCPVSTNRGRELR